MKYKVKINSTQRTINITIISDNMFVLGKKDITRIIENNVSIINQHIHKDLITSKKTITIHFETKKIN